MAQLTSIMTLQLAEDFDRAFGRRAPGLMVRAETEADSGFLRDLFVRCSPLRERLAPEMLAMQWRFQDASHRDAHPLAMRRIALAEGMPVGRILVDWTLADRSQGIDIAVDPEHRSRGAGLAMLRAWVDVADAWERPCELTVLSANPARKIYERLGFRAEQDLVDGTPLLVMIRPVRQRPSAAGIS